MWELSSNSLQVVCKSKNFLELFIILLFLMLIFKDILQEIVAVRSCPDAFIFNSEFVVAYIAECSAL